MTALERENILPPLGHNQPPSPIELIRAELTEGHGALVERCALITGMAERLPTSCDDDDTANRLTEAVKTCTAFTKAAEAARKVAKQPHLDAAGAVDAFFVKMTRAVDGMKATMSDMLTAYQKRLAELERQRREAIAAEERRIAREAEAAAREAARVAREAREAEERRAAEARAAIERQQGEARRKAEAEEAARQEAERARLAAEQAEADRAREAARAAKAEAAEAKEAANAKAADMTRVQSDIGAVASLRTTWTFEVMQPADVPREFLVIDQTAIRAAIKKATDKAGNCKLKIPGVRIFTIETTVVR